MNSDSWCTPKTVTLPLARFFGGPVDLDPCSNHMSIVRAREAWTAGSLHRTWFSKRRRTLYHNPPYSRLSAWVPYLFAQLALAASDNIATESVSLVPVAPSAAWWQDALQSDALMFTRRLTFIGDKDFPARFDTVLLYTGRRTEAFRAAFADLERWYLAGEDARRLMRVAPAAAARAA